MNGADLLRSCYDELLVLLAAEIFDCIPGFNDGIEDPTHPLRRQRQKALGLSLTGMVDAIDSRHGVDVGPMDWGEHIELGRMERRHGRPLGDILRAPWAASRIVIRFVNERAPDYGLPLGAAQEAVEVVIDWSDQISIAFSEGYNDETAARAGELETHRQHLLRIALADSPPSPEALTEAAVAAEWRAPSVVRVLVATGPNRHEYRRRLPAGSLTAELHDEVLALVPGRADSIRAIACPVDDATAALGPPVALPEAAQSVRLARRAVTLAANEEGSALIDCTTNELDLVVLADRTAAADFSRRRLEPILQAPSLLATLDAWLANHGRPKAAASALGVHAHTVAYRMNQIRDRIGPIVDDPQRRLELHLATHIARHGP